MKNRYQLPMLLLVIVLIININALAQSASNKNSDSSSLNSSSEIKNETSLNSPGADFSPVLYGDKIVFISDRNSDGSNNKNKIRESGTSYCKLFSATKEPGTGSFKISSESEELDFGYHNGPLVFANNEIMFFTRTRMIKMKQNISNDPTGWIKNASSEFVNHLEIYSAVKKDNKWVDLEAFMYNNSGEYSVGHPALSPDGNTIYFVSDMPGGHGETDIYYCEKKEDGSWGKPVNAGKEINTAGKEVFPVVSKKGILYFSSDGHPGNGGLDIFSAKGSAKNWSNLINLEFPFNSPNDDFGIVLDPSGKSGYFSSNREGGLGSDDIYSFKLKDIHSSCAVSGFARDKNGKPLSGALVQFYKDGEASSSNVYSDKEGHFNFNIEQGVKYVVKGVKGEFAASIEALIAVCKTSSDSIDLVLQFKQQPQEEKEFEKAAFTVINIYYDLDKFQLTSQAIKELDKIVKLLTENSQISIELKAHADSRAGDDYNLELSERRALSARDYIVAKGIDQNRIIANGYGKSQLVNHCIDGVNCPEEFHRENRRAEIKIIQNIVEVKNNNQ